MDPLVLFHRAEQSFAAGRNEEARALLRQILAAGGEHAAPLHLLALTEKRLGEVRDARAAFEAAMRLDPSNAEIATNAGHFYVSVGDSAAGCAAYERALATRPDLAPALRGRASCLASLGRKAEAREAYRALLAPGPADARSWTAFAAFERDEGDLDAAAAGYERALALAPSAPVALHGRARVALERGEADAATRFAAVERLLPEDPQVALGAAEAAVAGDQDEALARLEAVTERFPGWAEPHAALARLRWERGERDLFAASLEAAVRERPASAELWRALVAAYAGVDMHAEAAAAAVRASRACGEAEFRLLEAINAGEAGDLDRADALFQTLPPLPGAAVAEARHRLRRGDPDRAERLLDAARAEAPADQLAWAWTGIVWRLTGSFRSEWLHRPGELIGAAPLDAEAEEIEAIADAVGALHHARAFPIGQSLRGGTQTRGRLFDRTEPPMRRLRALIAAAVERYWAALPPPDEGHPLLRHRNGAPRFAGSWSVRLTGGGFHVAHSHPRGLLSSACYLRVPFPEAGALELGCAPAGIAPSLGPLATIEPEPGRLALFPSFLFHGTRPFGKGERLTVAFDVVV